MNHPNTNPRWRLVRAALADFREALGEHGRSVLAVLWLAAWQLLRLVICALLVLLEPILRVILLPIALLGFAITLFFGFAMDAPNFPKWGMLAFSVGALVVYWLFLGLMSLFMRLPYEHPYDR